MRGRRCPRYSCLRVCDRLDTARCRSRVGDGSSSSCREWALPCPCRVRADQNAAGRAALVSRISLIIPSVGRPESLRRALAAAQRLQPPAHEVIVVARKDDEKTLAVASQFDASVVTVERPGLAWAMRAGAVAASGEVVAFTDDDAEVHPDWSARLLRHYEDGSVGGVGGRDLIDADLEGVQEATATSAMTARIGRSGRVVGDHHLAVGAAREVDHLKGVNCSFRREPFLRVDIVDALAGSGAQARNDFLYSLGVAAQGYRLVLDPEVLVDHHPAPRLSGDDRAASVEKVFEAAFNERLGFRFFRREGSLRNALFLAVIGYPHAPGLARLARGARLRLVTSTLHGIAAANRIRSPQRNEGTVNSPSLAIVPSCETFEDHFSALGVTAGDLANGRYRGTWITQYAELLRSRGTDVTLVVPGATPARLKGSLMDVWVVPVLPLRRVIPPRLRRWKLRELLSYLQGRRLARDVQGFDRVYAQEYAYPRFGGLMSELPDDKLIGAHHGTPVAAAPRWLVQRIARGSNLLTTLTKQERESVRSVRSGSTVDRVVWAPNWVSDTFINSEEERVAGSAIWVGRFDERVKGLDTLLRAWEDSATSGWTLTMVGTGPDHDRIRNRVEASANLRDRVTLTGRIDDPSQLAGLVARAEVFVNASVKEGLPIAVLEAMGAGTKLVLSDLPYVRSELAEASAEAFPPGDVTGLLEALARAFDRPLNDDTNRALIRHQFSITSAGTRVADLLQGREYQG
ncbi:hypothetical protein DEI86_04685 [Curtobacterium sp. MCBD17_028]|nr:hypothetical protein DEI86_04685 [Curtobacterium sp. MCBD17_028]